jgi:hypothetical protein
MLPKGKNRGNQGPQPGGQPQPRTGHGPQCSICKKSGHAAENCRSENCQLCWKQGHLAQDCRNFCRFCKKPGHNASKCHQNPNNQKSQQRSGGNQINQNDQCTNCHQFGHVYSNCPQNPFTKGGKVDFCGVCSKYGHLPSNCPRSPAIVSDRYCMCCHMSGHEIDECQRLKVEEQQILPRGSRFMDDLMQQFDNNQIKGGGRTLPQMQMKSDPNHTSDLNFNHIHTSQLSYQVDNSGDVVMEDTYAECHRSVPTNPLLAQQQEKISKLNQKLDSLDVEWDKSMETVKEQFRREFLRKYYETRQQLHDQEVQQMIWE